MDSFGRLRTGSSTPRSRVLRELDELRRSAQEDRSEGVQIWETVQEDGSERGSIRDAFQRFGIYLRKTEARGAR